MTSTSPADDVSPVGAAKSVGGVPITLRLLDDAATPGATGRVVARGHGHGLETIDAQNVHGFLVVASNCPFHNTSIVLVMTRRIAFRTARSRLVKWTEIDRRVAAW